MHFEVLTLLHIDSKICTNDVLPVELLIVLLVSLALRCFLMFAFINDSYS